MSSYCFEITKKKTVQLSDKVKFFACQYLFIRWNIHIHRSICKCVSIRDLSLYKYIMYCWQIASQGHCVFTLVLYYLVRSWPCLHGRDIFRHNSKNWQHSNVYIQVNCVSWTINKEVMFMVVGVQIYLTFNHFHVHLGHYV